MPDTRSRREKLEAMAADTSSPNEAAAAKRLLGRIAVEPERGGPTGDRVVRIFVDEILQDPMTMNAHLRDEIMREMRRHRQEREETEKFRYERPRYDTGPFGE